MRKKQSRRPEDYIYQRLTVEDRVNLRACMVEASNGEGPSEANCDLGNADLCVPCKPPYTEDDLRTMLALLAAARVHVQTHDVDWESMLKGAFAGRAETIHELYEVATGLTDAHVFDERRHRKS